MMSAVEMGAKRGREYFRLHSLEELKTTTLEQYSAIGRLDARQRFKQKRAQDDYALGWFQVGSQFLTLLKPEDNEQFVAEKEMAELNRLLHTVEQKLKRLSEWRAYDARLAGYIGRALDETEQARAYISKARDHLKGK